jgi:hypothetical protein
MIVSEKKRTPVSSRLLYLLPVSPWRGVHNKTTNHILKGNSIQIRHVFHQMTDGGDECGQKGSGRKGSGSGVLVDWLTSQTVNS